MFVCVAHLTSNSLLFYHSWLLAFKQNNGFLKIQIVARAMISSEFEPQLHTQMVQIARSLISRKEASNCHDLFKYTLKIGLLPAKVWRSSIFSGMKIAAMIPILKIPYCSKKRSLDLLLLLFKTAPEIAKTCLIDCMSDWADDLEFATWELVLDSAIIRMRTNNLFYRLSHFFGNYVHQDFDDQKSRDVLSGYMVS
jgi:hypothetical protein